MILDYSNYTTKKGESGIVNYTFVDTGKKLFSHDSICPFCKEKINNTIFSNLISNRNDWLYGSFVEKESVVQCPKCGWWEHKYTNQSDAIIDGIRANDIEINSAILKKYDDSDKDIPLSILRKYIEENPLKIYGINAHKMAELVRSVFSDFYPYCKVYDFGKTRDGGKDGLIVESSGKHIILQVKRRTSPSAVEGVSPIRELLGVAMLETEPTDCIFVTTADHYSKDAKLTAEKAIELKRVERFELYNCQDFLNLINITRKEPSALWKTLLKTKM